MNTREALNIVIVDAINSAARAGKDQRAAAEQAARAFRAGLNAFHDKEQGLGHMEVCLGIGPAESCICRKAAASTEAGGAK